MDSNDRKNFLSYINTHMSRESINILYNAHNIQYEKCELYSDFVQSLLRLIFDTYMGDEVTSVEHQIKHFNWCWKKNVENFETEGLVFESERLHSYFLEFMLEVYYTAPEKDGPNFDHKNILKLWYYIFDYNREKSNSDMDTLIEIYVLFEKSLKFKLHHNLS